MNQLSIDFSAARAEGDRAAEACMSKAERVADFDAAGAARFIVSQLVRHGDMSGEALTDAAVQAGFRCHDQRCYGPVYAGLARKNQIRCVGFVTRRKGHGTAGGRVWGLVR